MKKRNQRTSSNSSSTEKSPKKLKINVSPSRSNTAKDKSTKTTDPTTPGTPESLGSIFDEPTGLEIDAVLASNSPQAAILNNFNNINNTSSSNAALYPNLGDITIPSNINQESMCTKILNKIKNWYR